MGLFVLAGVLAVLAAVAWRRGRRPVAKWFAGYTLATAAWVLGIAALATGGPPEAWGRFTFASASLIPAGFLGFARIYPSVSRWLPQGMVRVSLVVGVLIAAAALLTPWVIYDVAMGPQGLRRATGPLYPMFAVYFLTTWVATVAALVTQWRGALGMTRTQLRYLGAGLLTGTLGAMCTNLLLPWITGSSHYSALGPYFVLPYFLLAAHTVLRHRLFNIRVAIGRVAAFLVVITGGALVTASVAALLSPGSLALPAGLSVGAVLVLGTIAVLCSAPIAPRIDALLNRYLFRGQVDLDRTLSDATRRLTRVLTPQAVARELEAIVTEALVPEWTLVLLPSAGLWVASDATPSGFHNSDPRGLLANAARAYANHDAPAVRLLPAAGADAPPLSRAERALRDEGAEVVLLLGRQNEQRAIAVLGARRDGHGYLAPGLAFLDELARLGAMALDTAFVHARELALQREEERVAHLSRLSRVYASLAHEIRTPLQTISSFVSMLPDSLDDPEYRMQLLRLVPAEVQRILSLAERLRALAPEAPPRHDAIALGSLLKDMATLIRPSVEQHGIRIDLEIADGLPSLWGDRDRLTQLFQNLLRNAIEASDPGGRIAVRAWAKPQGILVHVADEGTGLQPAVRNTLFEPFVSTKGGGRGLGLSICLEIVEAHGATMTLSNRSSGRGAVAEVLFPRVAADATGARPAGFREPARTA